MSELYHGNDPVYKTFDCLTSKKIAYQYWDTIEPEESIIELKKKILFKNESFITFFIPITTRKYTVFDHDHMYQVDRWQVNTNRIKKQEFKTDIQPIYFNYTYLGWSNENWYLYSEHLYKTFCPDIIPIFILNIPTTEIVCVFTKDGIYKISIELQSVSSAVMFNKDEALHAVTSTDRLIYSTENEIKVYDTMSWDFIKKYDVKTIYFDMYNNNIWAISSNNLWYSKDKWFKLPTWHKPKHIKLMNAVHIITQSDSNIIIWAYNSKRKIPKVNIHASGNLYIIHIIPLKFKPSYYDMDNQEIFMVDDNHVIYSNLSLDQPAFKWPLNIIDWINGDEDMLDKKMLCTKSIHFLEKTIPSWFGRILEAYELNTNTWEPGINNITDVIFLNVNYQHIKDSTQKFLLDYFINMYKQKNISSSCLHLLVDFIYAIKMNDIFKYDNIFNSIDLPSEEFDFMFMNIIMDDDEHDKFCQPHLLDIFNNNLHLLDVKCIFIKIQNHIKDMKVFIKNKHVFEIIDTRIIESTSKTNLLNEWIELFQRLIVDEEKKYDFYPEHLDKVFKTIVKNCLNINTLRMFYYPNDNDGIWKYKKFTDINNKDWILMEDVIYRASKIKTASSSDIMTWVQHEKTPRNSLERALFLLDTDVWCPEVHMGLYENQFIPIGHKVKSPEGIDGIVIDFNKQVRLSNGEKAELDTHWKIEGHHWKYYIDPAIKYKAESWIQHIVSQEENIHIPTEYKKTMIKCLRPTVFNVETSWGHISGITTINMDKFKNLWLGFRSGLVIMLTYEDFLETTQTYKGHWKDVRSIQFYSNLFVTSSSDREIRIWDRNANECLNVLKGHTSGVEKAYFINRDFILSIDKGQILKKWYWKTNTCHLNIKMESYNYTLHRPILNMPITMHMPTRDRSLIICDRGLFIYMNDKVTSCEINNIRISSFTLAKTTNTFLVGSVFGMLYSYEIDNSIEKLYETKCGDCPLTAIKILDSDELNVIIGDDSGYIYIYNLYMNIIYTKINLCSNTITDIIYRTGDEMFIKTGENKIYYCSIDFERPEICCKIIKNIMKNKDWTNIVKTNIPALVKDILHDITAYNKDTDDIFEIITHCIDDINDRKIWCEKKILSILLKHVDKTPIVNDIITKLFCFQGKTFKCPLCLCRTTSPRSAPISFISTCAHRFHKKCLMDHVKKFPEWSNECLNNWALFATLKCPICNEPFSQKHVKDDLFVSEVCQYVSDEEQ